MPTATRNAELAEAGRRLKTVLADADDVRLGYAAPAGANDLTPTITVAEIPELIRWRMLQPELRDHTLCFLGPSAIGKTEAIRQGFNQACADMHREPVLHELHVSQMGPTDVMGVPRDDGKGRTVWYPPRMYPLESANPEHAQAWRDALDMYAKVGQLNEFDSWMDCIGSQGRSGHLLYEFPQYGLFFDEVTNPSNPSILHQCFSIWHGKFIADHRLLGDTFVVLAGNRVQDRTNSIPLAASATSRLDLIEVVPSLGGWLRSYAMQETAPGVTRIHPLVITYLHRNPHQFAPDTGTLPQMEPFPAPRNWKYVSDLLYADPIDDRILFAAVAGRVGARAARDFWSFKDFWRDLPDVDALLAGELPERWPTRMDVLYILGTQMVARLSEANSARFMELLLDDRMFGPEVAASTVKLLRPAGKLNPLADDWQPELFTAFGDKYYDLIF